MVPLVTSTSQLVGQIYFAFIKCYFVNKKLNDKSYLIKIFFSSYTYFFKYFKHLYKPAKLVSYCLSVRYSKSKVCPTHFCRSKVICIKTKNDPKKNKTHHRLIINEDEK